MRMWIFLVELIGFDRVEPETPEMILSVGNAPLEDSKESMNEDLFIEGEESSEEEEDEFGFNEFDDDYSDDDLNDYNEYEY